MSKMTRLVDTLSCHNLALSCDGLGQAFGRNVRVARVRRSPTQEDLEGMTGLRRSYISDLERGTRNPTIRALERLAAALEVLPAELVACPTEQSGGQFRAKNELFGIWDGAAYRTRTCDPRITNAMLYQLS